MYEEDDHLLPPEELDDCEFTPYRVPKSLSARRLVNEAINDLLEAEVRKGARQRSRRKADQQTFEKTVAAIICDTMHRELTEPGEWLMVSFDKSVLGCGRRYRATALNSKLPDIVRALDERRWIELEVGYHEHPFIQGRPSKRTRIRAGDVLRRLWIESGTFSSDDFALSDEGEVIILRAPRRGAARRGANIDYRDDATTNRYRDEVRRINRWLAAAPLSISGAPPQRVSLDDRRMRRIFNDGSFRRGGRLYGGFWQRLPAEQRLQYLRIGTERVALLDYGQIALRLFYAKAGVRPMWTDGYLVPGLERHREGAKKLIAAMLNRSKPMRKLPKGVGRLLPGLMTAGRATYLIQAAHPPMKSNWRPHIGMELQFEESGILIDVLLRLMALGVVALPVHDAVVVRRAHAKRVKEVMLEVFSSHTSIDGSVEVAT